MSVAATHLLPVHTPLRQSESRVHVRPFAHPLQLPPQSTSVSVPSLALLEQACSVGAAVVGDAVGSGVGQRVGAEVGR